MTNGHYSTRADELSDLSDELKQILKANDLLDKQTKGRQITPAEKRQVSQWVDRLVEIETRTTELEKMSDDTHGRSRGAPIGFFGSESATGVLEYRSRAAKWGAVARGQLRTEHLYRPDNIREANFWSDLVENKNNSIEARERLDRNAREAFDFYEDTRGSDYGSEVRDMGNTSTAGGDFVPPLYLADAWVHPSIQGRPFADSLPKYPLPPTGTAVTIPQLASGVSVAARASGGAVSETDGVTASISHTVNEYAGLVDIDRIAVMRSDPGLQDVLTRTLVRRYNNALDVDLISGNGSAPHHQGIDGLSGANTVTYTDGSPTGTALNPKLYNGIDKILEARSGEVIPDLVLVHSRRSSWLSYQQSSSHPLVQQGSLWQGFGTQDHGGLQSYAGLRIVVDNNITTTAGASTNEDRIYVLASEDYLLAEGPLYARVHEDVGSGTGTIRFAVFAFSAFLSKRYPGSSCTISGTGLAAPTWT